MIRKLIRSRGGDQKDAEDIFQEALIILIRKIKSPGFALTAQPGIYPIPGRISGPAIIRQFL
jgi:hypothetical protein